MSRCDKSNFKNCFYGRELYGDNFSAQEIESWYQDEEEGYADLGAHDKLSYRYLYHAVNEKHGFSKLRNEKYHHVLGLGSAYGDELRPILNKIEKISILDPSDKFVISDIEGVPIEYKKPSISGEIPFENETFDLITCFGTLHHIPNVSFVISEMSRVLKPSGIALIREPVINMGDWREPRQGLTKRERGIPRHIMEHAIHEANLNILSQSPCFFPRVTKLTEIVGLKGGFNSAKVVMLDTFLSQTMRWNQSYNRPNFFKKFAPSCIFWVCEG